MTVDDPRVRLLADLAEPTRLGILELLERGPMSATALAQQLAVSPTQLANHLRRLRDAGLVRVEHEGRLAVYELAEPGLREIFSMLNGLRRPPRRPTHPAPDVSACYDHLAGPVGVALFDHLVTNGALKSRVGEGQLVIGPRAAPVFAELGVQRLDTSARRMPAYACLDSSLRRPHLGGSLGADLAQSLTALGWINDEHPDRQLTLTRLGRRNLAKQGIKI